MSLSDYEGLVSNIFEIDRSWVHEIPNAAQRAVGAGAVPPLRYIGSGMTAHVFTDTQGLAFKVASSPSTFRGQSLADEAAWLKSAGRSKATRHMVPAFIKYDPVNQVIVREHVKGLLAYGRHPKNWKYMDEMAREKFVALEAPMQRKGWTVPEQKPESWAFDPEDPSKAKIFDAGMASKIGRRLVAHALRLIQTGASREDLTNAMFAVRNEATHWKSPTIRRDVAMKLLQALALAGGDPEWARPLPAPNPRRIAR